MIFLKKNRHGVSGIVTSNLNINIEKTLAQLYDRQFLKVHIQDFEKIELSFYLKNSIFLKHLSQQIINKLMMYMKKKIFQAGQIVIKEGEQCQNLYVIIQGQLIAEALQQNIKYIQGQIYGQMSIMYAQISKHTIICSKPAKIWQLNRWNFTSVILEARMKKYQLLQNILNKNNFCLSNEGRQKIIQNMEEKHVNSNIVIFKQEEYSQILYFVGRGSLVAEKIYQSGKKPVEYYVRGDFFSDIHQLCQSDPQVQVKTMTACLLYCISAAKIRRLIGSISKLIHRDSKEKPDIKIKNKHTKRITS